ncbi:chromate efflux transporter [Hydrocarboniclastica marina]|uniref:Chromate transporter n=1 Tax=Hydrocarboniclastica marina TaxID=2259620 RepID=A0A4P7XI47_9ALTE|nr:chromate efflux transporter [Hydrocarboniclastica marina]MAL96825.1 chromate transporter [Alteromonadaceae bacterium]QCF25942.1 chromate transporter [Hydrocarboniclastica marina]
MREVTFKEALAVWIRIGFLSFGGPAGQIALMHQIIVDEKKWLDEPRFLHALNYCMLLPGPEAQQLATYVGWLLHGVKGGVVAGVLFILPGAIAIFALSWLYVSLGDVAVVEGVFFGLKAAVLAIVVQAMIRIGRRALKGKLMLALAVAGFMALFVFGLPFPLVVLSAAIIGYTAARRTTTPGSTQSEPASSTEPVVRVGTRRAALVCLLLWLLTLGGLLVLLGPDNVFSQIAVFFSKMATVTFGGAYAVLAYVAQQGVENFGWLQPGEMLEGLGLAETTPGPLILVTQFVGFLAAYREAGIEPSLLYASLGACLTLWVTFLPCFLWIFAGAPYVEKLRANKALSAALAAVTAVVVGVIANLALWFAVNALFTEHFRITTFGMDMSLPVPQSVDLAMAVLSAVAFILVFRLRMGVLSLLGILATLGALWVFWTAWV